MLFLFKLLDEKDSFLLLLELLCWFVWPPILFAVYLFSKLNMLLLFLIKQGVMQVELINSFIGRRTLLSFGFGVRGSYYVFFKVNFMNLKLFEYNKEKFSILLSKSNLAFSISWSLSKISSKFLLKFIKSFRV